MSARKRCPALRALAVDVIREQARACEARAVTIALDNEMRTNTLQPLKTGQRYNQRWYERRARDLRDAAIFIEQCDC